MKAVFLSRDVCGSKSGGSEVSSNFLSQIEKYFPANHITRVFLCREQLSPLAENGQIVMRGYPNRLTCFLYSCFGFVGELRFFSLIRTMLLIKDINAKWIFLDSTSYGILALLVRLIFPSVSIVTFAHNNELKLARDRVQFLGIKYITFIFSAYLNDRLSAACSKVLFTLSDVDRIHFRRFSKGDVEVVPVSLVDRHQTIPSSCKAPSRQVLFVGSAFYPNIEAVDFINDVLANTVSAKFIIVGKGLENYRTRWPNQKLEIVGTVADVSNYYAMADCVLCPVFKGSGVKVKIAEALMHYRFVVYTSFSAIGYDICHGKEGFEANTAAEFKAALEEIFLLSDVNNFKSRALYERMHSGECSALKIENSLRRSGLLVS